VSPAFGGDRRIGEVMMGQMKEKAEQYAELLKE